MRGRLGYFSPDTACLTKIVLAYHLMRRTWLRRLYMASSALRIRLTFFTPYAQTIGQCTDPGAATLIFRVVLDHSKLCVHTSLTRRSHYSLLRDHGVTACQKTRRPSRLGSPKGGHHQSVHHSGTGIGRSHRDHGERTFFQSHV